MVNDTLKHKLKKIIFKQTSQIKYQRLCKTTKMKMGVLKPRPLWKTILNIVHRFVLLLLRFVFKNIIYPGKGQTVPPIKNLLLLEPATTLAMKIRTGKISSVEVVKAFIERIEVSKVLSQKFRIMIL